ENAELAAEIERLYNEAKDSKNGQTLLDPYSGNSVFEYFAQGMMSYINPKTDGDETARHLYSRNPRLFELVREHVHKWRELPPEVPGVEHPRVGEDGAGDVLSLEQLRKSGSAFVSRGAKAHLEHLQALYDPQGLVPGAHKKLFGADSFTDVQREAQAKLL